MRPYIKSAALLVISSILMLIVSSPSLTSARAQGTRADYERANSLPKRVAGKVFRASVKPHWIGGSGYFWYRNDLSEGRREFVLVDPKIPAKRPAFDHARVAAALTHELGKPVTAEHLPIDQIAF